MLKAGTAENQKDTGPLAAVTIAFWGLFRGKPHTTSCDHAFAEFRRLRGNLKRLNIPKILCI